MAEVTEATELGPWERELVRGEVTVQLLGGELVVFTRRPRRSEVLRGAIRTVGIEPGGLQPATRWQLTGPRQDADLGEYVGDYVDAERMLLDATPEADQINDSPTNDKEE